MDRSEIKLLRISKETWNKLKRHGRYGDTHDDIIKRLLEKTKVKK